MSSRFRSLAAIVLLVAMGGVAFCLNNELNKDQSTESTSAATCLGICVAKCTGENRATCTQSCETQCKESNTAPETQAVNNTEQAIRPSSNQDSSFTAGLRFTNYQMVKSKCEDYLSVNSLQRILGDNSTMKLTQQTNIPKEQLIVSLANVKDSKALTLIKASMWCSYSSDRYFVNLVLYPHTDINTKNEYMNIGFDDLVFNYLDANVSKNTASGFALGQVKADDAQGSAVCGGVFQSWRTTYKHGVVYISDTKDENAKNCSSQKKSTVEGIQKEINTNVQKMLSDKTRWDKYLANK